MVLSKGLLLGTLLLGASVFVAGCDNNGEHYRSSDGSERTTSDLPTIQEQWQHDKEADALRQQQSVEQRQWDAEHGGYSGAFACHTADGGCLHMTCSSKPSCDYMQAVEAKCAAPTVQDPKVIAKVVVADDSCKSVEKEQSSFVATSGTGWITTGGTESGQVIVNGGSAMTGTVSGTH